MKEIKECFSELEIDKKEVSKNYETVKKVISTWNEDERRMVKVAVEEKQEDLSIGSNLPTMLAIIFSVFSSAVGIVAWQDKRIAIAGLVVSLVIIIGAFVTVFCEIKKEAYRLKGLSKMLEEMDMKEK